METRQRFYFADSRDMSRVKSNSINLIVTSPAYPMIKMWDPLYSKLNPQIRHALSEQSGDKAFELMHKELDKTWEECYRVLKEGGIACINIGDATRTVGDRFQLYSNHSRIISACRKTGFNTLPMILWHKKTNAPNKFMGSGMLPAGAYVTLEHEYVLILRKGQKRVFNTTEEKQLRQQSAIFWEERNKWFSDIWFDLPGAPQKTKHDSLRIRSAAFPFELAYRLICMYSIQQDTVLDPFMGMGTTAQATLCAGRNSINFEIDKAFKTPVITHLLNTTHTLNQKTTKRLLDHIQFVKHHSAKKEQVNQQKHTHLNQTGLKYTNTYYQFPVMTKQETSLHLPFLESVNRADNGITGVYSLPAVGAKRVKQLNSVQMELRII